MTWRSEEAPRRTGSGLELSSSEIAFSHGTNLNVTMVRARQTLYDRFRRTEADACARSFFEQEPKRMRRVEKASTWVSGCSRVSGRRPG